MKIALVGYGNMGRETANFITENSSYTLVSVSYSNHNRKLDLKRIQEADVAIDFTSADIVLRNIQEIAKLGVPLVIGTTGWYEHLPEVKRIIQKARIGLVYGQNFSVGANIFFRMLSYGAKLMSGFDGYDVYGLEIHHVKKKDSPSGTAKKMAQIILDNFPRKNSLLSQRIDGQIKRNELHIASIRGGRNPGFHEVTFEGVPDAIKLSHQAHSRAGFAQGALLAAEFIRNKKGIFTFDDVFERQVKKNAKL